MLTDDTSATEALIQSGQWERVQQMLDEVAGLVRADVGPQQFHARLLDGLVTALFACGGAVWVADPTGELSLERWQVADGSDLAFVAADKCRHAEMLLAVARRGEVRLLAPHASGEQGDRTDGMAENPTPYWLLLAPIYVLQETVGLIELFQDPRSESISPQLGARVLRAVRELAEDFHRQLKLKQLAERESQWMALAEFARDVHRSLAVKKTAYAIVNEGRRLLRCDRVSLLHSRPSDCQLLAISSVATFNRRANSVRRLEQLASALLATGEPLYSPEDAEKLPPQIESALAAHLDESHARLLVAMPLLERETDRAQTVGVLIAEWYGEERDPGWRDRLAGAVGPSEAALHNALEHERIPFQPLWRLLDSAGWLTRLASAPRTIAVLAVTLFTLLGLCTIPADFTVTARGQLQPCQRQHVFAPQDGIVVELPAEDAARVRAGDLLAVLADPDLEVKLSELLGKLATAQEELKKVEAERLGIRSTRAEAAGPHRLPAQETQLRELVESLQRELEVRQKQQAQLQLRSPIDGQILTWDVTRRLEKRPVRRGERLLTVADVTGAWELELRVPDDQIGHLLAAWGEANTVLNVSYMLVADPSRVRTARVRQVGVASDGELADEPGVIVSADVDVGGWSEPRPGATVAARIHCGRRPLGYVWFHGLIETIQSRVLF